MSTIKSRKQSARNQQQYLAGRFTEFFQLEEGDIVSRSMGVSGTDLALSPAAVRKFPVAVEAKATTVTPGTPALTQAKANAGDLIPVVIWKPRGVGPDKSRVIMELEDWLKLIDFYKKGINEKKDSNT